MKKYIIILALPLLALFIPFAGCSSTTSTTTKVTAGPAVMLSFNIQPGGAIAGATFESQPVVYVEDVNRATVVNSTAAVSLSIVPGTGADGAVLSGDTTEEASGGIAVFKNLSVNLPGFGYRLEASAVGLASAASNPFNVTATTPTSTTTSPTTTSSTPAVYTVNVIPNPNLGEYLADIRGMTLYYTTLDSLGKSNVSGSLLDIWPIFYTGVFNVQPPLKSSDFAVITREDGQPQTTYKGWPLYYYANDKIAGDTLGHGVGGVWFVASPENIGSAP